MQIDTITIPEVKMLDIREELARSSKKISKKSILPLTQICWKAIPSVVPIILSPENITLSITSFQNPSTEIGKNYTLAIIV